MEKLFEKEISVFLAIAAVEKDHRNLKSKSKSIKS